MMHQKTPGTRSAKKAVDHTDSSRDSYDAILDRIGRKLSREDVVDLLATDQRAVELLAFLQPSSTGGAKIICPTVLSSPAGGIGCNVKSVSSEPADAIKVHHGRGMTKSNEALQIWVGHRLEDAVEHNALQLIDALLESGLVPSASNVEKLLNILHPVRMEDSLQPRHVAKAERAMWRLAETLGTATFLDLLTDHVQYGKNGIYPLISSLFRQGASESISSVSTREPSSSYGTRAAAQLIVALLAVDLHAGRENSAAYRLLAGKHMSSRSDPVHTLMADAITDALPICERLKKNPVIVRGGSFNSKSDVMDIDTDDSESDIFEHELDESAMKADKRSRMANVVHHYDSIRIAREFTHLCGLASFMGATNGDPMKLIRSLASHLDDVDNDALVTYLESLQPPSFKAQLAESILQRQNYYALHKSNNRKNKRKNGTQSIMDSDNDSDSSINSDDGDDTSNKKHIDYNKEQEFSHKPSRKAMLHRLVTVYSQLTPVGRTKTEPLIPVWEKYVTLMTALIDAVIDMHIARVERNPPLLKDAGSKPTAPPAIIISLDSESARDFSSKLQQISTDVLAKLKAIKPLKSQEHLLHDMHDSVSAWQTRIDELGAP
ncbi:hypothetical protein GQ42DRAFT_176641 [Ramicandelaber brevisporus]|nr:hypothetical protein GQ42DRAFT_176641 [Ramicandelaber brevisporus]